MSLPRFVLAALFGCVPVFAQESFWIANRASSDLMRVSSFGKVLERVAMPTTLRSAHTAPDGKVWVVRFIQGTFDIYDPATGSITPVTSQNGSPFQIAFDAQGHAWITGGTGVQEFDAAGNFVQSIVLPVTAPLGITIDADGNKWIAHRTTPASVSRIDSGGVVTNFPFVGTTTMLPVTTVADFRGLLTSSHIWVIGDSSGDLVELDAAGNTLHIYPSGVTSLSGLTFDLGGNIWVCSSAGALIHIDASTGNVINNFSLPLGALALATDSEGRVLATTRVTFSGVGPPCEVRRIDPATGAIEVPGYLQYSGFNGSGTQSAISTPFQYSLVVNPFGDLDGDGEVNYVEITGGTSPIDAVSTSTFRVETFGNTGIGNAATVAVQASPVTLWVLGYSLGLIPPTPVPGFNGNLVIDPTQLVTTTFGVGNGSASIAIANDPMLVGFEFFVQGVTVAATLDFKNVSGVTIW
ncbi:MAG TPA: hypothetical protein VFZ65_12105 [Planctomycetota bacterium]|nr:hypothetical protein [Planctomycetota bacterium]